jgi:uncharacterized protein (DUF488 family)
MAAAAEILTIGHSNHTIERFVELLLGRRVTAVADVRSAPYSRRHPQFNREALATDLAAAGIAYSYLGKELGGRRGMAYSQVAETADFRAGIERLIAGAARYRIAVMCAEREPLECHRGLLVAPALEKAGAHVSHILADGTGEGHAQAMDRLMQRFELADGDMFRSREELVEEALRKQRARLGAE